jgi:hypothetical protein
MKILLATVIIFSLSACGLFRFKPNYDPELHERLLTELNKSPDVKARDSLIRLIESAPQSIPDDVSKSILIVEVYDYQDFLQIFSTKYSPPVDTEKRRKWYKKFDKHQYASLKDYDGNYIYANKSAFDTLDIYKYRYILKSTGKLTDEGIIYLDSTAAGWGIRQLKYIYDRQTNRIFNEFNPGEGD